MQAASSAPFWGLARSTGSNFSIGRDADRSTLVSVPLIVWRFLTWGCVLPPGHKNSPPPFSEDHPEMGHSRRQMTRDE